MNKLKTDYNNIQNKQEFVVNNGILINKKALPIGSSSLALIATASSATILIISLLQGHALIAIPGIGLTPYVLTLSCTCLLYGSSGLLIAPTAVMVKLLLQPQDKTNYYSAELRLLKRSITEPAFTGILFVKRFVTNPSQVGAIAPSSRFLAREITAKIPDRSKVASTEPRQRYLEIGAGTGVFTRELVKKLGPQDRLDVVEYDADFCRQLRSEFSRDERVTIHQISLTDFNSEPYDFVVSGLPLNAFEPPFVALVLQKYEELTKENGVLSYFEYIALEKVKKVFLSGQSFDNFCLILNQKASFTAKYDATHSNVYANLPPARVQYCTIRKNNFLGS